MAGRVKRAPTFFQVTGLEWLYRLLQEPSRICRPFDSAQGLQDRQDKQIVLPMFALEVLWEKIKQVLGYG